MSLNGYDISNNQGNIDNGVVPGDFVIIKATEGIGYTDPDCDANYQQAKAAGKLLGVYHFARPDGNPNGADEADWFVSQVQGYLGEAILALDFETAPFDVNWAKSFLDRVYELTSVRPLIYSYQSVLNNADWSSVWRDYGLWLAEPGSNPNINGYLTPSWEPTVNGAWNIVCWQYSSHGRLNGWNEDLDLDLLYGDANTWRAYAVRQNQPSPPPAPEPAPLPEQAPQVVPMPEVPVSVAEPQPVIPAPVEVPQTPVLSVTDPVVIEDSKSISKKKSPVRVGLIEVLKIVIFSLPAFAIQILTNNPDLTLGYGGTILAILKYIDAYVQANPNIDLKGLMNF